MVNYRNNLKLTPLITHLALSTCDKSKSAGLYWFLTRSCSSTDSSVSDPEKLAAATGAGGGGNGRVTGALW